MITVDLIALRLVSVYFIVLTLVAHAPVFLEIDSISTLSQDSSHATDFLSPSHPPFLVLQCSFPKRPCEKIYQGKLSVGPC